MHLSRRERRALAREKGVGILAAPLPQTKQRPSVTIAIPLEELMFGSFFTRWLEFEHMRLNEDRVATEIGSFTWIARNSLVRQFLGTKTEYILFLDSDNAPPVEFDFIERLTSHGKDIVSGWYNVKKTRLPTVYRYHHWNEIEEAPYWEQYTTVPEDPNAPKCQCGKHHAQTIEKVDATGAGCLLIHRRIFEKMPEPWFGHFKGGGTEDLYFAWHAKKMGIDWFVDWSIHLAHIGIFAA